jgi:hypothetical protein
MIQRRTRDRAGVYRAKCRAFARRHGWDDEEIWIVWQMLDDVLADRMSLPEDAREHAAYLRLEAIYAKAGLIPN